MNFRELCNCFHQTACVVSVQKTKDGYGEIRIVDGSDAYVNSFGTQMYANREFVPNALYTYYLQENLNFEEYAYRSAVNKELLHSYAYPEYFKSWMHMLFIPIDYQKDDLYYCLYIMEINDTFNPELLANPNGDIYSKVLNTTLQLSNSGDFQTSMNNVTREIRKICKALFCCILLVDNERKELQVLAEDREPNSGKKEMKYYMDDSFYDLVQTWGSLVDGNGNCLIVHNAKGMEYIKERNPEWYESLTKSGVGSLVLFRLKSGNDYLGYMWVTDFEDNDIPKIKEALEVTTFVLGSQIGHHLLLDKMTKLSSTDILTGLNNRNRFNSYINEIMEAEDVPTCLIFLDINGLKVVNDKLGHLAGDDLIKRAAKTLRNVFSNKDIFRVGGDEFVVILRDIEESEINSYIKKIHEEANENNVSFSLGYAISNKSKEIEELIKEADFNMYNDKRKFYHQ